MQILIHAPWDVNEYLERTITKKVKKLQTYYKRIEQADIYLKMGDTRTPHAKIVKIRLAVPKNDLFAEDHADSFEKAVIGVTEKLQTQLRKHKHKLIGR